MMKFTDYNKMYNKINRTLKDLTPLKGDCGQLCGCACCKGDKNTGMRLFPYEESTLEVKELENGVRLVICDGTCERNSRPLACKIFPFFPTIDEKEKVYVELDYRASRLCPMIDHYDEIIFDRKFLNAVKRVGKLLCKDEKCRAFLVDATQEIDLYRSFLE